MALNWDELPTEIQLRILEILVHTKGCKMAALATVSRHWQAQLEQYIFSRITLTPSRLEKFSSMIRRNQSLVRYIWLCLELDSYDCTKCVPSTTEAMEEDFYIINTANGCPITATFEKLFLSLSMWDCHGHLTLDISIHSPSDSEHWFKYLSFVPDIPHGNYTEQTVLEDAQDDPRHGWVAGRQSSPPVQAFRMIYDSIMSEGPFASEELEWQWWDRLPKVTAVTHLLLRQQNRRRWKPNSLAHMCGRFPGLRELHYEPWREWDFMQDFTDEDHVAFFGSMSRLVNNLERLVVFENFNQQYRVVVPRVLDGVDLYKCDKFRRPAPTVSRGIAAACSHLKHIAVSFIADASYFFETECSWEWPRLKSLAITSTSLRPDDPAGTHAVLQSAIAASSLMPQLEIMEIWNGQVGLAGLFRFQKLASLQEIVITWRTTWDLPPELGSIETWEALVAQPDGWRLSVFKERLDEFRIKSHADAIEYLQLSCQVVRPISLQQIRVEQNALEGAEIVQR
ncbi:hypothetical protein F5Y18DRAFT_294584 [Xylariaceae sp. FL1019]|nr:hypothetical protein F5Y18DRAFT_294584 [Xylariaceae sp. FL1019]